MNSNNYLLKHFIQKQISERNRNTNENIEIYLKILYNFW